MTYLDIITRAYRLRNVIDANEEPNAEQGVEGLNTLNDMMAQWLADGVDLQYIPIEPAALADELTIPDYSRAGVTAHLAIRLAAGAAITPELQAQAESGYTTITNRTVANALGAVRLDHVPNRGLWRC